MAAEEAPATATESGLPDTPQLPKSEAQKAMKEPAKPQTPVASMDANKGTALKKVVHAHINADMPCVCVGCNGRVALSL